MTRSTRPPADQSLIGDILHSIDALERLDRGLKYAMVGEVQLLDDTGFPLGTISPQNSGVWTFTAMLDDGGDDGDTSEVIQDLAQAIGDVVSTARGVRGLANATLANAVLGQPCPSTRARGCDCE